MIRCGYLHDLDDLWGCMGVATQEEAERLSHNRAEEGIIVIIPYPAPLEAFLEEHVNDAD